jgi:hypothetical protein
MRSPELRHTLEPDRLTGTTAPVTRVSRGFARAVALHQPGADVIPSVRDVGLLSTQTVAQPTTGEPSSSTLGGETKSLSPAREPR